MARMLIAIFGLSAAVAGAVRPGSGSKAAAAADFVCPEECLECCQAHATGFFGFGWLGARTDKRFKCVLKDRSSLPPDCNDTEAQTERRTYMGRQYKVTCPFVDGLEGSEAKARRKQLPSQCSQHMDCCCDKEDKPWLECLPKSEQAASLKHMSKKGSEELFIAQEQARDNPGPCVDPSLKPLKYQVHLKKMQVSEFSLHDRCCIRVGPMSKKVKTGSKTHTAHMGRYTKKRTTPTYGYPAWTGCKDFEKLFHCSEDKGVTQSGSLYKRVPFGQCFGEKSDSGPALINGTYSKVCPSTHFSKDCMCEEEC